MGTVLDPVERRVKSIFRRALIDNDLYRILVPQCGGSTRNRREIVDMEHKFLCTAYLYRNANRDYGDISNK
jgi:hypothetical protein